MSPHPASHQSVLESNKQGIIKLCRNSPYRRRQSSQRLKRNVEPCGEGKRRISPQKCVKVPSKSKHADAQKNEAYRVRAVAKEIK